jgi:sugar fermentation stimulation protein A
MLLVDVDGENVYAHLPNSGRLTTALHPGARLYLRRCLNRGFRKSIYSAFASEYDGVRVIVDAQFSNHLARETVERDLFNELADYRVVKENVKPEDSNVRLDFLLEGSSGRFYLEVKSVTHVVEGVALFPDAPTSRGRRHILELSSLMKNGFNAGMIFSIQRPDAVAVKPNADVDPEFANLLRAAVDSGLKIFSFMAVFEPPKTIRLKPNEPVFSLV